VKFDDTLTMAFITTFTILQ